MPPVLPVFQGFFLHFRISGCRVQKHILWVCCKSHLCLKKSFPGNFERTVARYAAGHDALEEELLTKVRFSDILEIEIK